MKRRKEMKKGIIVLMLILCMCIPVSADETESSTGYSEKDVTVLTDAELKKVKSPKKQ